MRFLVRLQYDRTIVRSTYIARDKVSHEIRYIVHSTFMIVQFLPLCGFICGRWVSHCGHEAGARCNVIHITIEITTP